jgi:hypothetical protein
MKNIEIWRDVKDYEGLYRVSNLGRVKSLYFGKERILKPFSERGYQYVELRRHGTRKGAIIHRLVATAFIQNPIGKREVNHKDFNKVNNHVENLEWVTKNENAKHAHEGNRYNPCLGEKNGSAKLTEAQVKRIRLIKEITPSLTLRVIADMFGVSKQLICDILLRKNWRHI